MGDTMTVQCKIEIKAKWWMALFSNNHASAGIETFKSLIFEIIKWNSTLVVIVIVLNKRNKAGGCVIEFPLILFVVVKARKWLDISSFIVRYIRIT
jgi:hypothetical protein